MYNAVLITAVKKTKEGNVELVNSQTWVIQKIIETGPSVTQVKKGDIVLCNINALEKSAYPLKLKDKEYLLITERDIMWIYDEDEIKNLPVFDLFSTT